MKRPLSARESSAWDLYIRGFSRASIARKLGISAKTADELLRRAKAKSRSSKKDGSQCPEVPKADVGKNSEGYLRPGIMVKCSSKNTAKSGRQEMQDVLERDRGLVKMLYKRFAGGGAISAEEAGSLSASGVGGEFRRALFAGRGAQISVMSATGRGRCAAVRVSGEHRRRFTQALDENMVTASPARVFLEGDAVYVLASGDAARVLTSANQLL